MNIDLFSFSPQDCAKDKRKRRPNMHMVWEALEKIVKDRQQKEHLGEADFFAPEAAAAMATGASNVNGLGGERPQSTTRTQNFNSVPSRPGGIPTTGLLDPGPAAAVGTDQLRTDTR